MDILHEGILKKINEIIEKNPEGFDELDLSEILMDASSSSAILLKRVLVKSAKGMLNERRKLSAGFIRRNIKRWAKAFDLLETHIVICTEAGEDINAVGRQMAAENNDLVFDLVVRHHARACHIAQEILCLLKSGYADAAHARWRALHEVNVTARFIAKHGQECAERFYFHRFVDAFDGMMEHKKYEDRLQEKAPPQSEINEYKLKYDELIAKYGVAFGGHYGWAAYLFSESRRLGFAAIEKNVELDHMRPYYKWASQNIHAGSMGMSERLGLCESKQDGLLVGQSNSGMTDPAHAAAISLAQITCTTLMLHPTFDHVVTMKIIDEFQKDIGDALLSASKKTKI